MVQIMLGVQYVWGYSCSIENDTHVEIIGVKLHFRFNKKYNLV